MDEIAKILATGQVLPPEESGWLYNRFLPERHHAGQRDYQMALPSSIRDAVNGMGEALTTPREALLGHLSPEALKQRGIDMGSAIGGSAYGVPKPANVLGVFGGTLAKTADHAALERAMQLEKHLESLGVPQGTLTSANAIRLQTGWFRGPEGKWRFEIPDSKAKLDENTLQPHGNAPMWNRTENPPGWEIVEGDPKFRVPQSVPDEWDHTVQRSPVLSDVLNHPELYKAYPELAHMPIANLRGAGSIRGAYDQPGKIHLAPATIGDMLSTTLHETQHGIQDREGFAFGGSSDDFLPPDFKEKLNSARNLMDVHADAIRDRGYNPSSMVEHHLQVMKGYPPSFDYDTLNHVAPGLLDDYLTAGRSYQKLRTMQDSAYDNYHNLAGEIEARTVQERHRTGDYSSAPWDSASFIPYDQQIVKLGD